MPKYNNTCFLNYYYAMYIVQWLCVHLIKCTSIQVNENEGAMKNLMRDLLPLISSDACWEVHRWPCELCTWQYPWELLDTQNVSGDAMECWSWVIWHRIGSPKGLIYVWLISLLSDQWCSWHIRRVLIVILRYAYLCEISIPYWRPWRIRWCPWSIIPGT